MDGPSFLPLSPGVLDLMLKEQRVKVLTEKFGRMASPFQELREAVNEHTGYGQFGRALDCLYGEFVRLEGVKNEFRFNLENLQLPTGSLPTDVKIILPHIYLGLHHQGAIIREFHRDKFIIFENGTFTYKSYSSHIEAVHVMNVMIAFIGSFCRP